MTLAIPQSICHLDRLGERRELLATDHDTNQRGYTTRPAQIDRCRNGSPCARPATRSIRQAGFDIGADQ